MREIRKFARQVAERFRPDKIILFGSYAYGTPHADSDVDILVVMPARNQIDQAFKIHVTIDPPFPVHVIVRTPSNLAWRLAEKESFHTEIVTKGKVLYETSDASGCEKPRPIIKPPYNSRAEASLCMTKRASTASSVRRNT